MAASPRAKGPRADTPSLFDSVERQTSLGGEDRDSDPSNILLGTSAFTADGWSGSFYPPGLRPADYLSFYATRFRTVELDSTFYRTPAPAVVKGWYEKTPLDFIFAAKVPRVITHERVLVDCDADWRHFLATMEILREKLGPILLQFGYFNRGAFKSAGEFLARLAPFLEKLPPARRFAVEIRNKNWLDARFLDLLRQHNVALALIDQAWMPRPWEMPATLDPVTSDFTYVRWLGDRKGIEATTKTWDKTVVDRRTDLGQWAHLLRQFVEKRRGLKVFAYANNHYAGHGPQTVRLFRESWESNTG
jgi:uncharacterized protein YecE (DUF72 family)